MRLFIAATVATTLPALYMRWYHIQLDPRLDSMIFGLGILGAAFLLSWGAEVAQMDMSRGLALAILALIAVLPEYAVDLYFAWVAAQDPQYIPYVTANMTGANRLLVGGGWPFIVLLFYLKFRKKAVQLDRKNRVEIAYLTLATLYAFTIPFRHHLTLIDCVFLVGIFGAYAWRTAVMEVEEPELVGPARLIGQLPKFRRRLVTVVLFGFAGVAIFACAEPFAEALISSGTLLGIDEYFLVQWLAPIASEAPEFIIAALWTLRGQAQAAIGALISSKVNQWTLLVGTIPLVYSISLGRDCPDASGWPSGSGNSAHRSSIDLCRGRLDELELESLGSGCVVHSVYGTASLSRDPCRSFYPLYRPGRGAAVQTNP